MNNYVMDDSGVIETQFRDIVTLNLVVILGMWCYMLETIIKVRQ